MQATVYVEAGPEGGGHGGTARGGEAPPIRCQTYYEVVHLLRCFVQGIRQVGVDGYAVRFTVQHLPTVLTRIAAVDDTEDAVAPGKANQSVGRLSVGGIEGTFAVDEGGSI